MSVPKMISKGFTLLEVLIYVAIFAIVLGFLSSILIITTRVEMRESAAAEVTQQSSYIIQTIQRLVRESSQIESAGASNLVLRMASSSKDKTTISLSGGKVYIQEGSGGSNPLTSDKVTVNSLNFQKFSNPPGKDVVEITVTMTFNSSNPQFAISKSLRSAIARASAATFDSSLLPNIDNSWSVGQSGLRWTEGNFSGIITAGGNIKTSAGDFYAETIGKGLIIKSPDGTCWRLRITDIGNTTTTSIACP